MVPHSPILAMKPYYGCNWKSNFIADLSGPVETTLENFILLRWTSILNIFKDHVFLTFKIYKSNIHYLLEVSYLHKLDALTLKLFP